MASLADLLILALATWRLAYLISKENAPFNLMGRFRTRFPLGGGSSCIYCVSVWCAAFWLILWQTPLRPLVYLFAISGAALMLATYSGVNH